MSFFAGVYIGGVIVHVVMLRGQPLFVVSAGLYWPLLVIRGLISDLQKRRP